MSSGEAALVMRLLNVQINDYLVLTWPLNAGFPLEIKGTLLAFEGDWLVLGVDIGVGPEPRAYNVRTLKGVHEL